MQKKSEHPTATPATTFHKHVGEANTCVQFGYVPQIIFTPEDKF